jgi:hypothetical protein
VGAKIAPVLNQMRLMSRVLGPVERPHRDRQPSSLRQQLVRTTLQSVVFFHDRFIVHIHPPSQVSGYARPALMTCAL